jgi:hypothetical protein
MAHYTPKISYVFLIHEIPKSDDIFMDFSKEMEQWLLLLHTTRGRTSII